jgi:hypothetical protein
MYQLVGQYLTGRHIVTVGETTREAKDLIAVKEPGFFAEAVNVYPLS